MKAIYFLLQILLSMILYYSCLVSIYISFIKNRQTDFLTFFFVLTLFLFSSFSLYIVFQNLRNNLPDRSFFKKWDNINIKKIFKQNKKLLIVLILSLTSLLIGFFNVYTQYPRGVSTAEIGQYIISTSSENIIDGSKRQQQPPLDYYLSSFSQSLFGESKFSMRFHTMFFYLMLSFIFPLGIFFFCSSIWMTAIGSLLFLFNHVIRLHCVDARPLNLALLTAFLFLFFYLSYFKNFNKRESDKNSLFFILASQYLFVVSIGLQPVIFIISLFFSSFWLFLLNKKIAFKKLFITHIVAALLTAPFYFNMILFGKSAYKFKKISINSIKSYFSELKIFYFIENYFFSFYRELSYFFLTVIMSFIFFCFSKKRLKAPFILIASSVLLFPILFDFVFQLGIIWNGLHNWYIIVFSLLIILFVTLSLVEIDSALSSYSMRIYFKVYLCFLFVLSLLAQIQSVKIKTQFYFPYRDNSIEKVYEYLKEEDDRANIIAFDFSLTPILIFRHENINLQKILFYDQGDFLINNFYLDYHQSPPYFYELKTDFIYYIKKWPSQAVGKNLKILFIVERHASFDKASQILSHFINGLVIGKYIVFSLTLSSPDKEKEYIEFLSKVNKKTPKKYKGAVLETLIYYAYRNNNKGKFFQLLQSYREIEPYLDEFIPEFNYPSRFELRRRVKYFESLNWSSID